MAGPRAGDTTGRDTEASESLDTTTTTCRRDECVQAAATLQSVEDSASPEEDDDVVHMTLDTASDENVPRELVRIPRD